MIRAIQTKTPGTEVPGVLVTKLVRRHLRGLAVPPLNCRAGSLMRLVSLNLGHWPHRLG